MKYRPEIDGLRAIAVVPVILFHAGLTSFSGGFVGVDVFFVISGYLITTIILREMAAGNFSVASFYERRARRILPALFLVLLVCVPFAWALMLPVELMGFFRSLISTLVFAPNIYYWRTINYFSPSAEEVPLLHTWSLGVEEQFYLVFPLTILVLWKFGLRALLVSTIVLSLISFGLSEWGWRFARPSTNFFLPFSRAWELLLGSILAQLSFRRPIYELLGPKSSDALSLLGLLLIAAAVFGFDRSTPTPSVFALIPTLGAALVIGFAQPGTWVSKVLSSKLLVMTGLISYCAYLWHQPIFAFAKIRFGEEIHVSGYLVLSSVTMILAYVTWRYVERFFRSPALFPRRRVLEFSLGFCFLFASLVVSSEISKGFISRLPAEDVGLAAMADSRVQGKYLVNEFESLAKRFSSSNSRKMLLVGDSYAQDFLNSFLESGKSDAFEVRTFYIPSECQIYFGSNDVSANIEPVNRQRCDQYRNSSALKDLVAHSQIVVLAGSWRVWAVNLLPESVAALELSGDQNIFIVGPKKVGKFVIRDLIKIPSRQRQEVQQPFSVDIVEMEQLLERVVGRTSYVSMQSAVCGNGPNCRLFNDEGELISFDGTHLTKAGAKVAGANIFSKSVISEVFVKSD